MILGKNIFLSFLLNYYSCSLDSRLLDEVVYEKDSMKAYAQSQVFKYADSNQLYFTCQIRLCQLKMDMCDKITVSHLFYCHLIIMSFSLQNVQETKQKVHPRKIVLMSMMKMTKSC